MDHRHQRQKPVVRNSENAYLPVALGNVLHQPVDGVVGVGRLIHRRWILRSMQRAVHHIIALGAVLASNIFDHADVPALDDHIGRIVITVEGCRKVRAALQRRELIRAVRSARQQYRRMLRAGLLRSIRHQDHHVKLHAVAHRHHGLASFILEARRGQLQIGWSLAGVVRILGLLIGTLRKTNCRQNERSNNYTSKSGGVEHR